jgi:hypothetical protein
MQLQNIVPWGRSFKEYEQMFNLSNDELKNKKILGCSDGPASFNAELTSMGGRVLSVDPIYRYGADEIRERINDVYPVIMAQLKKNKDDYIWSDARSPDELGDIRIQSMNIFLDDYTNNSSRYIDASLPNLPFVDKEFDLALCSHFLFLYSNHIGQEEHTHSIKELCRVASEVRIYPLLSMEDNKRSKHIEHVINEMNKIGIESSFVSVKYCFQKGATEMLVLKNTNRAK